MHSTNSHSHYFIPDLDTQSTLSTILLMGVFDVVYGHKYYKPMTWKFNFRLHSAYFTAEKMQ